MRRRLPLAALFLGGLALLLVVFIALDVYRYGQRDDARPADAAIVLGAAVYGRRPSPVLRERINHALLLYEQGYVEKLIFTGGLGPGDALSEGEAAARYARAHGVPAGAILVETTSTSTRENLANARAVANAHGLDTFLLVSTPSHMRRAVAVAHDRAARPRPASRSGGRRGWAAASSPVWSGSIAPDAGSSGCGCGCGTTADARR